MYCSGPYLFYSRCYSSRMNCLRNFLYDFYHMITFVMFIHEDGKKQWWRMHGMKLYVMNDTFHVMLTEEREHNPRMVERESLSLLGVCSPFFCHHHIHQLIFLHLLSICARDMHHSYTTNQGNVTLFLYFILIAFFYQFFFHFHAIIFQFLIYLCWLLVGTGFFNHIFFFWNFFLPKLLILNLIY